MASGRPDELVLRTSTEHGCNLILIGGYSRKPVFELVPGSTVNKVLRESRQPILIDEANYWPPCI